jgi:uncharacterized protein YjbI with pentapeptide repeats
MKWWAGALLAVSAGATCLLIGFGAGSSRATAVPTKPSPAQLQDEKLQQEVRQLKISNSQDSGIQHDLLLWAPFVTGLAAIAAVGATLWKQATDLQAARTQLQDDHEKARVANEQWQERMLEDQRASREQEHEEALRRFDGNLSMVITNLGSESETLQVNAAAALATYLRPRYVEFHADLLVVLTANLRLRPKASVARVLRSDVERLLRIMFADPEAYGDSFPRDLDFSRASLQRLDVSAIDFRGMVMDVAFADLSEARLVNAKLFRLRGREVILERAYCSRVTLGEARLDGAHCRGAIFHSADLVSASLKQADLSGAQFQGALMQEVHLEGATLVGANFNMANIANAYFKGARFDTPALRTIARGALNWRTNNNFDEETKQALDREAHN